MSLDDHSSDKHPAPRSAWVRVATYLSGGGTPAERAATRQWVHADPARAAAMNALERAWAMASAQPARPTAQTVDVPAAWAVLTQRTGLSPDAINAAHTAAIDTVPAARVVAVPSSPSRDVVGRRPRVGTTYTPWMPATPWRTAAAVFGMVLLLCVAGVVVMSHPPMSRVIERTYATMAGQQATITLGDGSRVTLAPRSRLAVDGDFGRHMRRVMLVGEGYFDVASAAGAPFVVQTGAVTTRVLGTRFDVRHYATDSVVRVAVIAGKVSTGGRRTPVILTAGTVGHVTDTTATGGVVSDVNAYADWTSGRLVFDDASASIILTAVGQWYGYDFRYADSTLGARHFKATFNIASREKTLAALAALLNVTMTFDGSTITLHPRTVTRSESAPTRRWKDATVTPSREVGK